MYESEENRRIREHREDMARLRGLRPIDDDFMRCIFRDNIPLAQFVLRILTRIDDLTVTQLETQKDLKRLVGARSLCLDCYASDSTGKKYDLEIQRSDSGAGAHRARYHSGAMDIENLDAGQSFEELPDTYTIFITEHDIYGKGVPFYPIERMNTVTGEPYKDGSHILYVNGSYRDDSDIGKLMHDFSCFDPSQMNYPLMEEVTRYYKETQEGVAYMCRAFEEVRNEGYSRGMQQGVQQGMQQGSYEKELSNIKALMETMNWNPLQAMTALKIPAEAQEKYTQLLKQ
ncbi:MAG: PD-(D/E)XK nuclease family transposase [Oscillospiraceae bacterium]|nr:PD-(D/E)XK nuclease family transposase [Oscillospiraceae bacterium]